MLFSVLTNVIYRVTMTSVVSCLHGAITNVI